MKRKKTLLILGIILVLLIAVIAIEKLVTRHVESIQTTDEEVLTVNADDLTEITWKYNDADLDFVQTDGTWTSTDDDTFPVDQDKMADFLAHFESVHASFIIDDVEDYGQYGLDNPQCTINFITADGTTTLTMGDYSTMDSKRYISVGDGRVFLIDDDLLSYVSDDRDTLMANDEIPDFEQLEELTTDGENAIDVVYDAENTYTYTDAFEYWLVEDGNHLALSSTNVDSFMDQLTGMDLTDYLTYTATDDDLAQYGLDDPDLTITVRGQVEVNDDEDTSSDDTETTETEEASSKKNDVETEEEEYTVSFATLEDDEDYAYVHFQDSMIIYRISMDSYNDIKDGSYNTLRPTAVVTLDDVSETQIDMTADDASTTLTPNNDDTWTIDDDHSDIDLTAVLSAIDALEINEFSDEAPAKAEECSVTLHLDNEDYPELTIDIYQYDGDNCLVVLNGETVGLCDRSLAIDLKEAINTILLGL